MTIFFFFQKMKWAIKIRKNQPNKLNLIIYQKMTSFVKLLRFFINRMNRIFISNNLFSHEIENNQTEATKDVACTTTRDRKNAIKMVISWNCPKRVDPFLCPLMPWLEHCDAQKYYESNYCLINKQNQQKNISFLFSFHP